MNNTFESIANLPDNWNGNGASSFSEELISVAKSIYEQLIIKPEIYPTACDYIQFEWHDDDIYLKFEVYIDRVNVYTMAGLHSMHETIRIDDIDEINRTIQECFGTTKERIEKNMIVKGSELMYFPCDENDDNYINYMKNDTLWFYDKVVEKALSVYSNFIEKPDRIVIRTNWREVQFVWECKEAHLEVIVYYNAITKRDKCTDKYRAIVSLDRYNKDKSHNNVFDEDISADNILFINKSISEYMVLKEKKSMIYLDNCSTTQITLEVFEAMKPYLTEQYGNPSSLYKFGREARNAIEKAREQIAKAINAEPEQITFTSGATESNNWVLSQYRFQLCSSYEHHSVLKKCTWDYGTFNLKNPSWRYLANIVSNMAVNNETGEVFNIKELCRFVHEIELPFHTDATQAFGHIPIDVKDLDVDYLSLSAHKFHGPKGVGMLYIKNPGKIKSMFQGGHQEMGLRAGTENVASIVAMGKAAELYNYRESVENKIRILRDNFEQKILDNVSDVIINAKDKPRTSNISSLSFKGIEGEALMLMLDTKDICVSSGSACNSGSLEPSHVLKAMGVLDDYINGTIRVSLSEFTTAEELDFAADEIIKTVKMLR